MSFASWLDDVKDEIEAMQIYSKRDLPKHPTEIQDDLSRTTATYPRSGELLAEVDVFILTERAVMTLAVRKDKKYKDLTAIERKPIVEASLANMMKVRDILKTTMVALHDRHFSLTSQRAYAREELRLSGRSEG